MASQLLSSVSVLHDIMSCKMLKPASSYESLLPAPIAILEINGKEGVYIVPDLNTLIPLLGVRLSLTVDQNTR
jgi:hypothetical protein